MMRRICGDLNIKTLGLALSIVLLSEQITFACPACAVSGPQQEFWQSFWSLSVMGILPLIIAALVAFNIVRLQKNEHKKIT